MPMLFFASQTNAQTYIGNFALNGLLSALDGTAYLIGYIAGIFVTLGGTLVNWAFSLNSTILTSPTVRIGWTVSRDLANLGFVLAIILISFATILRVQTYAMQKLLSKLIVVALLVNFSLVFAGVFIDFSGVLTNFFLSKATSGNISQIGEGLAGAFHVQEILQQKEDESAIKKLIQGMAQDPNTHFPFTASVVFIAVFTAIIAMSLLSLAAMLFIRYIWLTILLILMPIAWLLWIWPDTEHNWKAWWGKFMQWTFFGPAVTFFLYLALSIAETKGFLTVGGTGNILDASLGITVKNLGELLGRALAVLGLLYGGLYTANSMGIAGAGVGFAVAKGVKNTLVGGVVTGGVLAGGLAGRTAGRLYEQATGKTFTEDLRNITSRYSRLPLIGGAMQTANRALATGTAERMERYQKEYGEMDTDARLGALKNPMLLNEERRAALINALAEKNELGKVRGLIKEGRFSQEQFNSFALSSIQRGGPGAKNLLSKDPLLAKLKVGTLTNYLKANLGKTEEDYNNAIETEVVTALKFMKPEAVETLDLDSLKENPAYLAQFKGAHLSRILERSAQDVDKFIETLEGHLKNLDKMPKESANAISAMATRINANPAWAGTKQINPELLKGAAPKP